MNNINRRRFLRNSVLGGMGTTALTLSGLASAYEVVALEEPPAIADAPRRLRLHNVHTGEKASVVYWEQGDYLKDSLDQINFLLRDRRVNEVMEIDTAVIEYLYQVYTRVESDAHIQILSGYRSPKTNEMLRKRSSNVAKNSLHILGRAIDFKIPGQPTKFLQKTALQLKIGGIGYYKKSDFVHIDSGPHRSWG